MFVTLLLARLEMYFTDSKCSLVITKNELFQDNVHYLLKEVSDFRFHFHFFPVEQPFIKLNHLTAKLIYPTVIFDEKSKNFYLLCPHLNRKAVISTLQLNVTVDKQCHKVAFINGTFNILAK